MARRSGLGRGLNALLPDAPAPAPQPAPGAPTGTELREVAIADIVPNPNQPRAEFDEDALNSLSASIEALGVLQPVLVRPRSGGGYELIAGERRWRASQRAGRTTIPAVVRVVDDTVSLEQALVENLHREDLNPIEEAAGYQQLVDEFAMTHEQVAVRVGRSRSAVANTVRLLGLPESVQRLLVDRSLTAGHARALLAVESVAEQEALADRVVAENLTVRETEEAVRRAVAARYADTTDESDRPPPARPAALLEVERVLGDYLDTRVSVTMSGKRGRLVVEFANLDDLDRVFRVVTEGRELDPEPDSVPQ